MPNAKWKKPIRKGHIVYGILEKAKYEEYKDISGCQGLWDKKGWIGRALLCMIL